MDSLLAMAFAALGVFAWVRAVLVPRKSVAHIVLVWVGAVVSAPILLVLFFLKLAEAEPALWRGVEIGPVPTLLIMAGLAAAMLSDESSRPSNDGGALSA